MVCLEGGGRTDSIGLAILCCHHERGLPSGVGAVDLCVVAEQQLETLHVVREGGCVQWRPVQHKTINCSSSIDAKMNVSSTELQC